MEKNPRQENLLVSLLCNVALPILVLNKLGTWLGPKGALFLALLFPFVYAVVDFIKSRRANLLSALGFCSVLIKGVFALYQLDSFWFACQEAALPIFLGLVTLFSAWWGKPLVHYLVYNENIFDVQKISGTLRESQEKQKSFQIAIWKITWVLGLLFFVGGVVNYLLARSIITSPAGTLLFNEQLGRMTFWSYTVIALPKLVVLLVGVWWFVKRVQSITDLPLESLLRKSAR